MANLRTNNLSGEQGQNAYRGSVYFRGYIDGTAADFLSVPESDDLDMGTGDFTLECWVRAAESSGEYAGILGMHTYSTNGFVFQIGHTGKLRIVNPNYLGHDDSTVTGSTVIIPQDGTFGDWHHLAVVRSSGTIKGYVNGVEEVSFSYSSGVNFANGGAAVIGATSKGTHPGDYDLKGYLSNLRLIKGTALYTTNYFTPPTSELTIVDGTVLLCCQDSDNPTQEATGKTITAHGGMLQSGNKNILSNGDFSQGTQDFIGDSGASISESGGVMTVTNGGGDNTFALRQEGVFIIGGKYRCTATVTPTFASGNPVFRVRFGGSGDSFVQPQSSMSTGVTFRLDTGEKVADGLPFEIGSGSSSGITQFTVTDLVVTAVNPPILPKVIPPYGVDAGNTFGGTIQQNSEGYMYFPTGTTEERGRGRGVIMGGVTHTPSPNSYMTRIDFLTIPTMGNSLKFGDLSFGSRDAAGSVSSTIRAIYAGGMGPSSEVATNSMSFITIATQGDGTDYGDLTAAKRQGEGCSNGVRGIFMGGENDSPSPATYNNVIDFCTIASIGNASDFGDLTAARDGGGVCSSPIRGVCGGGYDSGNSNIIDFVTIATTGNATDFGDLTAARTQATGCASATRGLFMGGRIAPNNKAEIDFITIASAGNASDFGDLSEGKNQASAVASQTRGVHIGGNNNSSPYNGNTMEFVTIASTGNATDFGDTNQSRTRASTSDCHGGLS